MKKFTSQWFYSLMAFFLLFVSACFFPQYADAASLDIAPSSGAITGTTLNVSLFVGSADQSINAVSGVLSFPVEFLEVTSVSKGGSVVPFWLQEPTFNNDTGKVSFEGVIFAPGYTGARGKVIDVAFRIKKSGATTLRFSSGSVLANDGVGTNVLNRLGTAAFTLGTPEIVPIPVTAPVQTPVVAPTKSVPAPVVVRVIDTPAITSETHTDSSLCYQASKISFAWALPKDVTRVRWYFGNTADAQPDVLSPKLVGTTSLAAEKDGIWYLRTQFGDASRWGDVGTKKVCVDSTAPSNVLATRMPELEAPGKAIFQFKADDELSGVASYEVVVSGDRLPNTSPVRIYPGEVNQYETALLSGGNYTLKLKVTDKAGNSAKQEVAFVVATQKVPQPTVSHYQTYQYEGEFLFLVGQADPHQKVRVWMENQDKTTNTELISDEKGLFTFVSTNPLFAGEYNLWLQGVDAQGHLSDISPTVTVNVMHHINTYWWVLLVIFLVFVFAGLGYFVAAKKHRRPTVF